MTTEPFSYVFFAGDRYWRTEQQAEGMSGAESRLRSAATTALRLLEGTCSQNPVSVEEGTAEDSAEVTAEDTAEDTVK